MQLLYEIERNGGIKMQVAICDDTHIDRELVADLLNQYAVERGLSLEFQTYANGESLLYDFEDGRHFDIIFLDIYLGDCLGIDIARKLREMHYSKSIVFLTMSPDFAVDSYDVEADGYLLKPHSYKKLCRIMDRITQGANGCFYQIRQRSTIIQVNYREIPYIESCNSKCILHRNTGDSYVIYKTLNEIEHELNNRRFLRCHQSFLVNMDYIQQLGKEFLLTTGDIIQIRQRSLRPIRQIYLDYTASKIRARSH